MNKNVEKMRKYGKIVLKLSGEALAGKFNSGFDADFLEYLAQEVKEIKDLGVKIGIVLGGGNIFRGLKGTKLGIDRVKGDYMGMLATVINSLALQSALKSIGVKTQILTSTFMEPYAERYFKERALQYLENEYIVIFAGGTGNPFFTTDSAAALRAAEIQADAVLKGTNVDGVYSDDPKKNPNAIKFDTISFDEVIKRNLKVMDLTAFTLCFENNIPIVVFDIHKKGNLKKIILGEKIGTLVN